MHEGIDGAIAAPGLYRGKHVSLSGYPVHTWKMFRCLLVAEVFCFFVQVGWDESTGERQQRVSVWDIEPLTTPFLLCPPPPALRSKRTRGNRGKNQVHCLVFFCAMKRKL